MPIVQNGRSPVGIRWVDEDGVEHQIIRVMLGDRVVFDGTMPVLATAPRASGSGLMMVPVISGALSERAPIAAVVGEALVPAVQTATHLPAESMEIVAEMFVPTLTLGLSVSAPEVPEIVAEMFVPVVGESAPGEFYAEAASGSAEMLLPRAVSPMSAPAATAMAVSEMLVPTIDTGSNAEVPVMTATAEFITDSAPGAGPLVTSPDLMTDPSLPTSLGSSPMRVVHGHALPASTMTASGQMFVPMIPQARTVTAPLMVGTGSAMLPSNVGRLGVQFSDNFNRANGNLTTPWLRRVSWTYSDFAIASNQLYRTDSGANDSADGSDAYIWGAPTVTTNQFAQLSINTITGFPSAGVVLGTNADGTTAGLWAEVSTSGWRIFSAVPASGSKTILASGSGTYTAGGVVRLEKSGSLATLIYKGAVLGTFSGALPSGLYVGVRAGSGSCRSDDWSGGDL